MLFLLSTLTLTLTPACTVLGTTDDNLSGSVDGGCDDDDRDGGIDDDDCSGDDDDDDGGDDGDDDDDDGGGSGSGSGSGSGDDDPQGSECVLDTDCGTGLECEDGFCRPHGGA